ncbi:MAG: DNA starvation/stationary phase protection protein [Phycisphaerae bacterium]|jgi:DNA-binding ferritin-like protein|nr:DNA starvation/stationary phase protection protein [Phycisphaerae bacterium]MCZ2400548.1 DNA starvation/stationary phase protection protein [Phycisphaerae bacterium]NUQ48506.1 DNA starvation/stationary phase protection protein [Phycisphaerae bacterium]
MKPWKPKDHVESNPIHLPKEAVSKLLPQLDRHLASLFVLFHQYQKHHWLVEGPQFHDLHIVLGQSYDEVHKQVDAVAERITALGGIPTSGPAEIARLAYVQHEPEGAFRIRQMLELDRAHEGTIAAELRKTIRQAFELGDFGTETLLRRVLVEVEDRAHHLDHFLGGDSLEAGRED